MSATPILTTFDAGELSPLMGGRVDFEKYPNGCLTLENFITTVQGPAVRRGGTGFVAGTKYNVDRTWLKSFIVSDGTKYMLEFGAFYIRFYANRGVLLNGSGGPLEVVTPYRIADLTDTDGTFALRFAQSADTMYIFHEKYPTKKLLRTSATTFELQDVQFTAGPFYDQNIDQTKAITSSAQIGIVTLTANFDAFSPTDVGTVVYLETQDFSDVRPWGVHKKVVVGDYRRVDKRVYLCTAIGDDKTQVTGDETPVHTSGREWDGSGEDEEDDGQYGSIGVEWEYQHSGYGYVVITGYTDARTVSGYVSTGNNAEQDILPAQVVSVGTWKWRKALFNGTDGYPAHGTFWRNRLVLARGRWLAMSVSADYENFAIKDADEQTDDSAIVQQLNARKLNEIVWLVESDNLLVGMNGDEWVVGPTQQSAAVSATNIQAVRRTTYGSRGIVPLEVGGTLLFVQTSGKKLRDYKYSYSSDNYSSTDTTKLADHITTGASAIGTGILSLAFQQEPFSVMWAARGDGTLIGMTYDQEEGRSDVIGWHRHPMNNGAVECVETMPSPDGTYDDLWMIVRRTVNGQTVRYVEYLHLPLQNGDAQSAAFYVDCGLSYSGAAATTISGLGHLEGQTVAILANGAATPNQTVSGGKVTLDSAASVVHVGLPTTCRLQTMQINVNTPSGTGQGKTKRISKVRTRFYRTLGGSVGPSFDKMEQINFRRPADPMDQAPPLFTGDKTSNWPGGYEDASYICYENDQPLPVTLLAFMPELSIAP